MKEVLLIFIGIHYGIGRHILTLQSEQIISVTKVGLIHGPYCMLNPRNALASVAHDTLLAWDENVPECCRALTTSSSQKAF